MPITILLVDDHRILLDGLRYILREKEYLNIKATADSGAEALKLLEQDSFDLMITDYCMPDTDGLTLIKRARDLSPGMKIIVLSMVDPPEDIRDIMLAGADGYILKKYARQELFYAIDTVMDNRQYWSPEASKALLNDRRTDEPSILTARELEVLHLLTQELTSREIASRLFISERTVETHRKNLLRKTGCASAVGLIKYAYTHKLI
ncbi:MAG: response regulator transcription factor [Chitinophagaceae bacterium]|nr:response regulator transcription factor [Chitinophagaceae bacterium]